MATRRVRRRRLCVKRRSRKQRGGNNPTIYMDELSHLNELADDVLSIENRGNSTYRKNRYMKMKMLLLFVLKSKALLNDRRIRSTIKVYINDLIDFDRDLIQADPDEMERKLIKLEMIINEMNRSAD